jgi:hypothetical protein
VLLALFNDLRATGLGWAASLPATEALVLTQLQAVATGLLENHAAEVLRVELLRRAVEGGNLGFGVIRPGAPPGQTVAGQAEWVPALQMEADRLRASCAAAACRTELQPDAIAARYQDLLAQFEAPPFLASGRFLFDMGGHELMAALAANLRGAGAPSAFTERFLADELLRVLIPIYEPMVIYNPDDFHELATILAQY